MEPTVPAACVLLLLTALVFYFSSAVLDPKREKLSQQIPLVNPMRSLFASRFFTERAFVTCSQHVIQIARTLYPNLASRIVTDWGEIIMLPPAFAHEIRNDPRLSFAQAIIQDNHGNLPGFQTVKVVAREDQLLQVVVRKQLTKHLSKVILPLSSETDYALDVNFGRSQDWHEVHLKDAVMDIIARVSSRVYLGDKLCRDVDWLDVVKVYTKNFFYASYRLRWYPVLLRPIALWFLFDCQQLRSKLANANKIIQPLLEERATERAEAKAAGLPSPEYHDALAWAEQEAAVRGTTYDPGTFQLTLSLLAIHTTFDLMQQVMIDLAKNQQFLGPLRNQIATVLGEDGWQKVALHKMHLLDSAIKESQRLKPGSLASMRRYVSDDVVLSNGLLLRKGSRINVDSSRMIDAAVHEDPKAYDAFRFVRLRTQHQWQHAHRLVATSINHLGFGHGEHSCPGRFFAASEIKIALIHLLMKYDWQLAPGTDADPIVRGMLAKSSPNAKILVRRREKMEIDIEALESS